MFLATFCLDLCPQLVGCPTLSVMQGQILQRLLIRTLKAIYPGY